MTTTPVQTTHRTARRNAARKALGSVAVVAVAGAVAGLGTFGAFTDSSEAMVAGIDNGVVSLDLAAPAQTLQLPGQPGGWVPGDWAYQAVDLVNSGTAGLSSVTMTSTALQSSLLDTDETNGLQMALDTCSVSWTVVGEAYECDGTVTRLYDGPVLLDQALTGAASTAAGGVDHLLATVQLPKTAGNEFQEELSTLSITFTGVQRDGTTR